MNRRRPIITYNHVLLGSLLSLFSATQSQTEQNEAWITIFVHGIMSVAPHLNFRNFTLFMSDDIVDTVYTRTVNLMRQDPFFYTNQAMQGFGLIQLNPKDLSKGKASNAIAHMYDDVTRMVTPEQSHNYYYTYGWSGLLSVSQRYQEAEGLLIGIHQLVQKFNIIGINPKVRIIGYSHGGNVSLNVAAIHRDKYPNMPIAIDELILLGMPVQVETDYLVASPIFKQVYHIYSTVDRIQQIDFFSSNRFFSDRIFKTRRHFKLPNNLTQVNLKMMRLRPTRYDKQKQCINATDFTKPSNISGQRRLWRDISPGHIELWFLGWISGKYRVYFPLYPLPALVTVPFIIAELKKIQDQLKPYPVIFDIRPELDIALIKQKKRNHLQKIIPFISHEKIEAMKSYAYAVELEEHSSAIYKRHVASALTQAHQQFDQQKKDTRSSCTTPRKRRRRFRRNRFNASAVDRCYQFNETIE